MLLVVMSASAACQVGMVHQSPGSCCNGSFSSFPSSCPFFLRSFFSPLPAASPLVLSSSSLPSPSPALLVSLYTVFIIAVRGLWLKICPLRQNPHFHEEAQRVVGVDNQVHGGHGGGWHDVSNIVAGSTPQGADKLWWLNLICHGACGCSPVARRAHRKCASL